MWLIPATGRQVFLICSDGLSKEVDDEQIARILAGDSRHAAGLAGELVDAALDGGAARQRDGRVVVESDLGGEATTTGPRATARRAVAGRLEDTTPRTGGTSVCDYRPDPAGGGWRRSASDRGAARSVDRRRRPRGPVAAARRRRIPRRACSTGSPRAASRPRRASRWSCAMPTATSARVVVRGPITVRLGRRRGLGRGGLDVDRARGGAGHPPSCARLSADGLRRRRSPSSPSWRASCRASRVSSGRRGGHPGRADRRAPRRIRRRARRRTVAGLRADAGADAVGRFSRARPWRPPHRASAVASRRWCPPRTPSRADHPAAADVRRSAARPTAGGLDGDHDGLTVASVDIRRLRAERGARAGGPRRPASARRRVRARARAAHARRHDRADRRRGRARAGRPSVGQVSGGRMPRLVTIGAGDPDISRTTSGRRRGRTRWS